MKWRIIPIIVLPLVFLTSAPASAQELQTISVVHRQENVAAYHAALVSLSNPAKLATLGERGANPRLKKIVYWLDQARKAGRDPSQVVDENTWLCRV